MSNSTAAQAYRLDGEIEGCAFCIHLALGEHRVGSSSRSEVRLAVSGVSRQHARLIATDASLIVEDCGSTNGTFIDDDRVDRAPVPAGAWLRFGPIRLRLRALTATGDRLAISLAPTPSDSPSRASSRPTTRLATYGEVGGSVPAATVAGIERLLDACPWSATVDAIGPTLDSVMAALTPSGACAVLWPSDRQPVVLAGRGERGSLPRQAALADPGACEAVFGIRAVPWVDDQGCSATAFVTAVDPDAWCGLVLYGTPADRVATAPLARAAARMIARGAGVTADDARGDGTSPSLTLPDGYCRCPSPVMRDLEAELAVTARTDVPVLIHGETGVGKELVARMIHLNSPRAAGPFVAINCAAVPADLMEAEMFGIGRGVATGVAARDGQFAHAAGGTLFLDEVGELARGLQAKLLRALQEREIQPVGAPPRAVDVRVVAATNVALSRLGDDGALRDDLFFRLAGALLEVPPLRRRHGDIQVLVEHFLRRAAVNGGPQMRGVTAGALARLEDHPWPGNVRELEHEVARAARAAAAHGRNSVIHEGCLSKRLGQRARPTDRFGVAARDDLDLRGAINELERAMIVEALERAGGRKAPAARLLGVSRSGFEGRLQRLGIDRVRDADDIPVDGQEQA